MESIPSQRSLKPPVAALLSHPGPISFTPNEEILLSLGFPTSESANKSHLVCAFFRDRGRSLSGSCCGAISIINLSLGSILSTSLLGIIPEHYAQNGHGPVLHINALKGTQFPLVLYINGQSYFRENGVAQRSVQQKRQSCKFWL